MKDLKENKSRKINRSTEESVLLRLEDSDMHIMV